MPFTLATTHRTGVLYALVAATAGAANPAAALLPGATLVKTHAGRVVVVERPEEQVFLMSLKLNQIALSDNFPIYPLGKSILVPLGELSRLLQFAIEVDIKEGRASGWFIDPKRTFAFDALTGMVKIGGQEKPVDPRRFEVQAQDIFVDAALLGEWFPLKVEFDLRQSTLGLSSLEKLPIQALWERQGKMSRIIEPTAQDERAQRALYTPTADPYRLAEVPAIDQTLDLAMASQGHQRRSAQSTTLTSGDLLGMEHSAYLGLSSTGDDRRNFRLTLGRRNPDGGLLGPLNATQYQFGDVSNQGVELVSNAGFGKGILISNMPLQYDSQFDRRTFRGNLPPGWQAELIHNGVLIGMQNVRPDGTYEFSNAPVLFGPNEYKLNFYGPQGERRTENYRSDINHTQVPIGQFRYRISGVDAQDRGQMGTAEGEYGLHENLTLGLFGASQTQARDSSTPSERHLYSGFTLRSATNHLASQVRIARMDSGKVAGQIQLQSGIGLSTFNFRHARIQEGFLSDYFSLGNGGVKSTTDVSTNFYIPERWRMNSLSLGLGYRTEEYRDQRRTEGLTQRISTTVRGFYVSNELFFSRATGSIGGHSTPRGSFSISRMLSSFSIRGSAGYSLGSGSRVDNYMLSADKNLGNAYVTASVNRSMQTRSTIAQVTYSHMVGLVGIGASLSHSRESGYMASVNLRSTFTRNPLSRSWKMNAHLNTAAGAVAAVAFHDLNGNGKRDPEEKGVEGVGFIGNGLSGSVRTDREGQALVTDFPSANHNYFKIDNATLADPLWRAASPGNTFVARSGHVTRIELPVVALSELDGTVYATVNGRRLDVPGLLVELLDASGKPLKQIRSAFDGYFILQDLPHGTYTLRIHPEDAQKRGYEALGSKQIILSPRGTQLDGQDLEVKLLAVPAKAPKVIDLTQPTPSKGPIDIIEGPSPQSGASATQAPRLLPQAK